MLTNANGDSSLRYLRLRDRPGASRRCQTGDTGRRVAARRARWCMAPMTAVAFRWTRWLDAMRQDLRFGRRGLRRNPGFSPAVVRALHESRSDHCAAW